MAFRGTFDHSLDAKNRLTVPSKFRAALSGGLVVAAGIEPCAAVWPAADYDLYVQRSLNEFRPLTPQWRQMSRYLSANAFDAELDSAGRVMLPARLIGHATLGKDVVVVGAELCLEVWDRETWSAYASEISPQNLTRDLAEGA